MLKYVYMKNCFKNFIADIKKATYGKDYKSDFAGRTFGQGVWFLSKLVFIEIIIISIFLLILIVPFLIFVMDRSNITSFVDSYVPADLQIDIKEGKVTTPDNEVVTIPLPEDVKKTEENKDIENVLVVDPNVTEEEIKKFEEYKTAVLITSDKIVSLDEGSIKVASMSDVPDYNVNRDSIVALYEKIRPFMYTMIPLFGLLGLALMFVFIMVFSLIFNLFLALVTLVVSKVKKVKLTYKESYVVTLFAIAPVSIISWVLFWIEAKFLLMIVLLIALVAVNLNKKDTN
jgi:hypothetical protein